MNKIYKLFVKLFLLILTLHISHLKAQVIELGTGSFTNSNVAGPANTATTISSTSRYAYIFPESIVNTLIHGDSIVSLDFLRNAGDTLVNGCNMKIYMRMTVKTDYGSNNIHWVNQSGATGMKKVYDNNPKAEIGKKNDWVRFLLTSAYVVDTTFGKNLEILIEYTQNGSLKSNIFWTYENRFTVNGYAANQCKYYRGVNGFLADSTNNSSDIHPTIKINFPRYNQDASVVKVYALGKLPVPLGNPDTVRALVKNIGKQSFNNQKFYIISKGANKLIDSANITLGYLETKLINLPLLYPNKLGLDTLIVKIAYDQNATLNASQTYRIATENIYSYKDPTQSLAGGIGFNNATGDFVAKFYSNSTKNINQITVNFAGGNQKFKLGIWKADGKAGSPKTNIWTSDTLTSSPKFTTPVLPPVKINGAFFVGVRQIGTSNVAFGYQEEDPVRPSTFYYTSPTGDTNWVDFAPDAPFKFAIEPRIQADNDVAPTAIIFTKDTFSLLTVKTIAPKATILNYGVNDQLTPYDVTMNISRYGSLVYTSTKKDTLHSLRKHTITFDSSFLPTQAGNYDVVVITKLNKDDVKDNDTLKKVIVIANYNDVGIGSLFDPDIYTNYEQYIDSVYPIANIQNFGLNAIGTFNVTAQILDSNKNLLYTDTKQTSLASGSSSIVVFNTYPCSTKGRLKFRIFTQYFSDSRKKNDTISVLFNVVRSNDVSVTKAVYPSKNKVITPLATAKFINIELENFGDLHQTDPFKVYSKIYYNNLVVYYDSSSVTSYIGTTTNIFFKKFLPVAKGYYQMVCYSSLYNDQVRANDTLKTSFAYGLPDDVEPLSPFPSFNSKLVLTKIYAPKITVRNNGSNSQKNAFSVDFRIYKNKINVYSSSKALTLDSGKSQLITFDSTMVLSDTGVYDVIIYTSLSKDFDKSNDTLRGKYYGIKWFDVGVSSILYPTLSDTLLVNSAAISPIVEIKNLGDSLVKTRFTTSVKIINSVSKLVLYNQTLDTSFTTNAPITLLFPKLPKISSAQNIIVIAQTNYNKDQYRKNDTTYSASQFEIWYDAIAQSIDLPINLGTYKTNSSVIKPVISIKNGGKKIIDNARLRFIIRRFDSTTNTETTVYADSISVLTLNSNSSRVLVTNNNFDFTTQLPGLYKCYLTALYNTDQILTNNSLQSSFRILDALGVKITVFNSMAIYPNPASQWIMVSLTENQHSSELFIYDLNGKKVKSSVITGSNQMIDVSTLANGVYFIEVNNVRVKLVVEH